MNVNLAILGMLVATYYRHNIPPVEAVEDLQKGVALVYELIDLERRRREGTGQYPFRTGNLDISPTGTAVQLSKSSIPIPFGVRLTVLAKPGNRGVIYFGYSKDSCENSDLRFDGLDAGLAHSFDIPNVQDVWFDAETSGDGVSWYVEQ